MQYSSSVSAGRIIIEVHVSTDTRKKWNDNKKVAVGGMPHAQKLHLANAPHPIHNAPSYLTHHTSVATRLPTCKHINTQTHSSPMPHLQTIITTANKDFATTPPHPHTIEAPVHRATWRSFPPWPRHCSQSAQVPL